MKVGSSWLAVLAMVVAKVKKSITAINNCFMIDVFVFFTD
jgi:hypothetical protein